MLVYPPIYLEIDKIKSDDLNLVKQRKISYAMQFKMKLRPAGLSTSWTYFDLCDCNYDLTSYLIYNIWAQFHISRTS